MKNPYLDNSFEIQWSRLTPDQIQPAIEEALAGAQKRIDAISEQDLSQLTFENTFLALEDATEDLSVAWGKVGHLDAVCNSPELREAYNAMLPEVSEFYARIPLNAKLWEVLKTCAEADGEPLTPIQERLKSETMADFREHGADLPPEKKKRLEEIAKELSQVAQKFSENVLDSTNAYEYYVEDEALLAGLPKLAKEQARQDALKKDHGSEQQPQWRFTLHAPSYLPVMKYLDDEGVRKTLWEAASVLGHKEPHDNTDLIRKILELREEKAQLLGKEHFADLVLERRMAKNGRTALGFVENLHDRIESAFNNENIELENYRAAQTGGAPEPLEPWDSGYWSEKLRREQYDFDEEELRPYFPIDQVIGGMFRIAEQIFGIKLVEREAVFIEPGADVSSNGKPEVWHPEVKYYELRDDNGELLGAFYADWHPRESKRSGAWMNYLMTGEKKPDGSRTPHLGLICGNLTPSLEGKPALLTHDEVQTIFHEFGHLLHHLLGDVEIKSLNGVNVAWDFVELPSQIMENWCWERESLNLFARHHETGDVIPDELFDKMIKARNFQAARFSMRQLSFGKLDLELHMHYPQYRDKDLDAVLDELLASYHARSKTKPPTIIRRFTHLFASSTGYAAGYYSYKWAEVLDADAFTRFKKEGVMNAETGREFREKILSKGNSEEADKLFRDFMGRDPDLEALLKRDGLA